MGDKSPECTALPLLGEVYRDRKTGVFSVVSESVTLRFAVRAGEIVGVFPDPAPRRREGTPGPEDSARQKLDRILAEVGLRRPPAWPARVDEPPDIGDPRDHLVEALSEAAATATFEATAELPEDAIPMAGATEPLILEALRGLGSEAIREILGNPDQRLVATTALAEEQRTLTLTEGYLLSRIDGQTSAREIFQLVPMEMDEAERTLAGLVLTGRVAPQPGPTRARPARPKPGVETPTPPADTVVPEPDIEPAGPPEPEAEPAEPEAEPAPEAGPAEPEAEPAEPEAEPAPEAPSPEAPPAAAAEATPPSGSEVDAAALDEPIPLEIPFDEPEPEPESAEQTELTEEQQQERREILEFFKSLPTRNHFQVLGLTRECTAGELKRAHVALVKRYHPDTRRDAHLKDLHDVLEAIFIRVGEAWEVLGNEKSRAAYEARFGPRVRPAKVAEPPPSAEPSPEAPPAEAEDEGAPSVSPEQTLHEARQLLGKARYWDAIQMLETAVPHLQPQRHQHRGRILLAQAYAQNPKWVHQAVETLQAVLQEDPKNAEAQYQLGRVYKAGGLATRAQAAFRKALELQPGHKEARAQLEDEAGATERGFLKRLFGGGDKGA